MDTLYYKGFFARDSLLARDTLLFREGPVNATETVGIIPMPMPLALRRNDIVTGNLLLGFAIMMLIFRSQKRTLRQQITDFFYPSQKNQKIETETATERKAIKLPITLLTALLIGLLFFGYTQKSHNIDLMPVSPLQLLAIYVAMTFAIIITKDILRLFTHAVFFSSTERAVWNHDASLINLSQCALLFPLTLMAVYFDLDVKNTAIGLLIVLLFVKIPLLFKAYTTFFVKSYGSIHIFVYFCALEAVPIVVLWSLLMQTTNFLELL